MQHTRGPRHHSHINLSVARNYSESFRNVCARARARARVRAGSRPYTYLQQNIMRSSSYSACRPTTIRDQIKGFFQLAFSLIITFLSRSSSTASRMLGSGLFVGLTRSTMPCRCHEMIIIIFRHFFHSVWPVSAPDSDRIRIFCFCLRQRAMLKAK